MDNLFVEEVETGEITDCTGDDPRQLARQLQFSMRNDGRHFNAMIKKTARGYELVSTVEEKVKGEKPTSKFVPVYRITDTKPVKVPEPTPKLAPVEKKKGSSVYTLVWNVLKFFGNLLMFLLIQPQQKPKKRK